MSRTTDVKLLDAVTTQATGSPATWDGGRGTFIAHADTWGGATVTFQFQFPNTSAWIAPGSDTTLTADGGGNFELPPCQIRAVVSAANPTNLTAYAKSTQ